MSTSPLPLVPTFCFPPEGPHAVQSFVAGGDGETWAWCGYKAESPRIEYGFIEDVACADCLRELARHAGVMAERRADLSGCDECGRYNPNCTDCQQIHPAGGASNGS